MGAHIAEQIQGEPQQLQDGGSHTHSAGLAWRNFAKKEEIHQKKQLRAARKVSGLELPGKRM